MGGGGADFKELAHVIVETGRFEICIVVRGKADGAVQIQKQSACRIPFFLDEDHLFKCIMY